MNRPITPPDAVYVTLCSYLGLSARDLAEIGGFSDRFARDLLAGRRPLPQDVKKAIFDLYRDFENIVKAAKADVMAGEGGFYIYRTNEQLRLSPFGQALGRVGNSAASFVGPYRAAMFVVWEWAMRERNQIVSLDFAETPEVQ